MNSINIIGKNDFGEEVNQLKINKLIVINYKRRLGSLGLVQVDYQKVYDSLLHCWRNKTMKLLRLV